MADGAQEAADTAVVAAGLAGAVEVMDRLWHFGEIGRAHV